MAPVIPALTDHEIESLLEAAAAAGARRAAFLLLRLPFEVAGLFEAWLREHHPDRAERVLNHVREMRATAKNTTTRGLRQPKTQPRDGRPPMLGVSIKNLHTYRNLIRATTPVLSDAVCP